MAQAGSSKTSLHNPTLASVFSTHEPSTLVPGGGYHPVVNSLGTDPSIEPDWSGAAASAAHVPLLPY